jgi:hypothetical protein
MDEVDGWTTGCGCLLVLAALFFLTVSPALEVALEYSLYRKNVYEDKYKPVNDDTAALKKALFDFKKLTYDKLCEDATTDDPKAFDCTDLNTATEKDPNDPTANHPVDAVSNSENSLAITTSTVLLDEVDTNLQHKHGSATAVTDLAAELATAREELEHIVAEDDRDTASRAHLVTTARELIDDGAAAQNRFMWLHDTAMRAANCPPLMNVYGTRIDNGDPLDADGNIIRDENGEPLEYISECDFLDQDPKKIMRDHQVRMLQCGFSNDAILFDDSTKINCND